MRKFNLNRLNRETMALIDTCGFRSVLGCESIIGVLKLDSNTDLGCKYDNIKYLVG